MLFPFFTQTVYQMKPRKINNVTGYKTDFVNVQQNFSSENVTFDESSFSY